MTTTSETAQAAPPAASTVPPKTPRRSVRAKGRIDPAYYWMVVPVLALFAFFITLPALVGVFFSLTNYAGYGDWKFIGLSNYVNIFKDPAILQSYIFTFVFALTTTVVVNIVALAIALGLNAKIKWRTGIRTVFFIPMVLSALVVSFVFNYLFSNTLPVLADRFGVTPLATSILANENYAWLAIVLVTVWQAAPGATIIYLAGLQSVPAEVYEAADLDGAGSFRQFRSLTLPLILGYLVINVILGFKGFLGTYEIIVGLTGGGPGMATQSVAMRIFSGFTGGDYSYQMANAVIYFLITLLISVIQLRLIQRRGVSL
ncbi:putative sugar ABC transporter permease protein [Arthrobacter globiformis NBRC 12137]|uniref:Putative sugar ABC transporter permease protein n=1 Tax=Arthrobacter globiformis (strain ATCC 8010 / DSM 20124 / JCM 1332 / NBRC 12137 / NCIMB 8907 / NRRL B-2979 / 168) TaxID=1077972 RepID=H0QQ26_ARTG1|nr:sugar ABC transporter permease [Arthrobacter globiformis]GAB14927.1 putative sugar ABC transporter permease protein [Arthrobacter globiformis NBRC 12137]